MFLDLVIWLLSTSIIGIFGLPFINKFLNKKVVIVNYAAGIPLFILLNGLLSWLIFIIVEDFLFSNLISLIILIIYSSFELYKNRFIYLKNINVFIYGGLLVFLFQALYLIYRSFNPDLIGTEKLMDFMMLSSVYNSSGGIVKDLWFSGNLNPYYYFGYWMYTSILKILFIDISIGYNLLLSITFSLTILISASVTYNYLSNTLSRSKKIIISSISPIFLVFISNFYILFEVLSKLPGLKIILEKILNIDGFSNSTGFFYGSSWRSTRVINSIEENISKDYTINEYPSFTFLLGDLHPHLISIPFVLLTIFFITSSLFTKNSNKKLFYLYFLIGFLIPINGFINIWDLPFLLFLSIISLIIISKNYDYKFKLISKISISLFSGLFISFCLLYNFYFVSLSSQSNFPFINAFPYASSFHHFFISIGFLLIFVLIYLKNINIIKKPAFLLNFSGALIFILIINFFRFFLLGFNNFNLNNFLLNFPVQFLLILLIIISFYLINIKKENYPIFLIISSLSILLIVENLRIIDLFNNRMNTIFKSHFQVWLLMSLFIPIFISKLNLKIININKNIIYSLFLLLIFVSTVQISSNIYYSTDKFSKNITLSSTNFIDSIYPGSLDAIIWIKNNTKKEDIIFHKVGADYEISSYFSAMTGRSTPIGWPGHQKQWGRDPFEINQRLDDLSSLQLNLEYLKKYNVNFYITNENNELSDDFFEVFDNDIFKIYKINYLKDE